MTTPRVGREFAVFAVGPENRGRRWPTERVEAQRRPQVTPRSSAPPPQPSRPSSNCHSGPFYTRTFSPRNPGATMSFGGQTPTIVVLREGTSAANAEFGPRGTKQLTAILDGLQGRISRKARAKYYPTLALAWPCSRPSRAPWDHTVATCCWWMRMAGRQSPTMAQQ